MQNQNNIYTSCDWVNNGIEFRHNSIRTCCFGYLQDQREPCSTLINNYKGEKIDWPKLIKKKQEHKDLHKNNLFWKQCQDCVYLSENNWDEDFYIDHVIFNHWTNCNCNCTYCYTNDNKKASNSFKCYNILPVIKDMLAKNILRATQNSCITFGGGEPTILKDFDKIVDLLIKNNFNNIRINSSGSKYSKSIEKGLKNGSISLVISPDAGTKETYTQIKRVNTFDKVWNHIKKYSLAQKNPNQVKVKYILIPGVNDNLDEIIKWFELLQKDNVKAIAVSIEQKWYFKTYPNFSEDIYQKIKYFEKKAKQLDLELELYVEALSLVKKYEENLLNKDKKNLKKYVSCNMIEHGMDTHVASINLCCRSASKGGGFKPILDNYKGEPIDWDIFFATKNKHRQQMREGNIIPECEGCVCLEEKEWDDEDYISYINFNNGLICNSRCTYCYLDKSAGSFEPYNVLPIIKDMIKKHILRPGGNVTIAGGEPTAHTEFEELLNTLIDHGINPIRVLTNGTIFSKALEKGLKLGVVNIAVSVDSGTKETFKKIKRIDAYDKVWENLKKYAQVQYAPDKVKTKFIIIPEVNDNTDEIDSFINKTLKANITHIGVDIEQFWYQDNFDKIPQHTYEILNYLIKKAQEKGLNVEKVDRAIILSNQQV